MNRWIGTGLVSLALVSLTRASGEHVSVTIRTMKLVRAKVRATVQFVRLGTATLALLDERCQNQKSSAYVSQVYRLRPKTRGQIRHASGTYGSMARLTLLSELFVPACEDLSPRRTDPPLRPEKPD